MIEGYRWSAARRRSTMLEAGWTGGRSPENSAQEQVVANRLQSLAVICHVFSRDASPDNQRVLLTFKALTKACDSLILSVVVAIVLIQCGLRRQSIFIATARFHSIRRGTIQSFGWRWPLHEVGRRSSNPAFTDEEGDHWPSSWVPDPFNSATSSCT